MKYNRLTFIEDSIFIKVAINGWSRKFGLFKCDCGNIKAYDYSAVTTGHTKQCFGCARKDGGLLKITHNQSKHPLYAKWQDMKNRCYNVNRDRYNCYGGLGITVCDEWKNNFSNFLDWCLSHGWRPDLQIDRKDASGNYTPSNCRFITAKEQRYNLRRTSYVIIDGRNVSLSRLLFYNNMSNKRYAIIQGMMKGKSIEYYIAKYNIDVSLESSIPIEQPY